MRPILNKIKSIKFKWIVAAFLALYCVIIILNITNKGDFFQWDFRGFYYCAKSASSGLDPYNTKKIACAFNSYIFPYCYTPFSLYFFKLFTFFRYTAAFYIFLFLKCVLLLALIIIWRDGFFGRRLGVSFFVLCLLGFDRAIYLDFAAGNVSIFEQIFLWLAFLFYLRKRLFLFCVFILLASVFKLQPIFFLVLLFLCEEKDKYRYFFIASLIFCLELLITRFFAPQLVNNFAVNALETFSEKGIINPCTFALVQEIVDFLPKGLGAVYHRLIFIFIYFAVLATVILLSLKAILKINSQKIEDKGKWLVFFICLVYALVAPRFKDYSYIILIPPTYFIMQKMRGIKAGTLFFVLVILSAKGVTLPGFDYICYFLWNYYPLFLAFMVWGVYLYELRD